MISTPYIAGITRRISGAIQPSMSGPVRLRMEDIITPRLSHLYAVCLEISYDTREGDTSFINWKTLEIDEWESICYVSEMFVCFVFCAGLSLLYVLSENAFEWSGVEDLDKVVFYQPLR